MLPPARVVRSAAAAVIVIAGAAACNDGLPTGSTSVPDCGAGSGMTHSGQLSGSPVWTKQDGPHRLIDSVTTTGMITIEAGALVCGTPGSVLAPAALRIAGTAESPVVLTATDPLTGWGGIRGSAWADSMVIRHAVIRHAGILKSYTYPQLVVENTTIVRSRDAALSGSIAARNVVIDSACAAAVNGGCYAVYASPYSSMTLVEPLIRDSRGGGVYAAQRSIVDLTGGTITGSAGVGMALQYSIAGSGGLILRSPVRITGGDSIPVSLAGMHSALAEREAQLQLLGNAIDEIHVHGGMTGEHEVYRELPWRINASCDLGGIAVIGTLRLEAGAAVTVDAQCDIAGEIVGQGTAADPILVNGNGVRLRSWDILDRTMPDTVRLTHARITNMHVMFEDVPAVLEDVELDQSSLTFAAAGSRLTRAHIHDSAEDGVVIAADDVVITDCTIENNTLHGVLVESGQPRIARCNLQDNGGAGISNTGAGTVDATDNWWGDASGPHGPDGDGIAGAVLYQPFRTTQVMW